MTPGTALASKITYRVQPGGSPALMRGEGELLRKAEPILDAQAM